MTGTFTAPWSRLKRALTRHRRSAPRLPNLVPSSTEKRLRDWDINSLRVSVDSRTLPISFDPPPVDRGHNEKLAINRLPPEILAEMFILVCEASDLSDYSWVGCSHVCSSWRAISLDMPHLWSHVVFSASEWTRVCIQRSKSALLVIDADLSIPWVEDRVCEVLKLADRVGSINIQFFALSSQATKLLGGPFPMLRSFSMDISNFLVPPNFILAMNPNMEPYPRLRNLQVHSNVAFLPPLSTRLVSLEIDNRAAVNVGWDGFAAALRLLTELEMLTLHGFPIPLISASGLTDRIPLPNLREIHLWGSPPDCTRILEAMDCPQIEKYDIHLYTVHDLRDMFRTVLGNLGRPPPKSMFLHRQYGTLTTDFFRNPFLDIGFYQHAVFGLAYADTRDRGGVATLDICFAWTCTLSDNDLSQIFTAVCEIPLLDSIEWFLLLDWNTNPPGSWSILLRRLIRLQTLVVSGLPPSGLIWDLVSQLEDTVSDSDTALLPELDELEINNMDFSAGGWLARRSQGPVNSYIDLDGARFLEVLVCYLELRPTKLPKLKVTKCHSYSGAEMKLLRRLVAEVMWDGVGLTPTTYLFNGDEFGAMTINHNLLSRRASYQELNLSDEERWRRQNWGRWG